MILQKCSAVLAGLLVVGLAVSVECSPSNLSKSPPVPAVATPVLTNTGITFEPVDQWVDLDSDGDLDAICGNRCRKNNGNGTFGSYDLYGPNADMVRGAWFADFTNDGRLDSVIFYGVRVYDGQYSSWNWYTDICKNVNGNQVRYSSLPSLYDYFAFGDYDNDGSLDAAATYSGGSGQSISVMHNTGSGFTTVQQIASSDGPRKWLDFDNDGDLDLILSNMIYRNSNGILDAWNGLLLPGIAIAIDDFDDDGDLDFLCNRSNDLGLYWNNNGTLVDSGLSFPRRQYLDYSHVAVGDVNNDGKLDVVIGGSMSSQGKLNAVFIYLNNGNNTFTTYDPGISGYYPKLIDYDRDGDLDLYIGRDYNNSCIYRNDTITSNTRPNPPTGLTATRDGDYVVFSWDLGTDNETPSLGLSYNLRVGSASGLCDVFSGTSDNITGVRRVVGLGNVQKATTWKLKLPKGRYVWSVQSIDHSYMGSAWASEQSVEGYPNPKGSADDTIVALGDAVVTAKFGNEFYIQNLSIPQGILVSSAESVSVGDRLYVRGKILTNASGERYIDASTVTKSGTGNIKARLMIGRSVSGGNQGLQEGVWSTDGSENSPVWVKSVDLSNVGLLAKVVGKVRYIDPNGQYFYIDDGSGLKDGFMSNSQCVPGLRVIGDGRNCILNDFVSVVGVSSVYKATDGKLLRQVKARDAASIQLINRQ